MFKRIKEWLAARRERHNQERFEDGFGYVMTQYYWHGLSKQEIADKVFTLSSDKRDAFDDGTHEALFHLITPRPGK